MVTLGAGVQISKTVEISLSSAVKAELELSLVCRLRRSVAVGTPSEFRFPHDQARRTTIGTNPGANRVEGSSRVEKRALFEELNRTTQPEGCSR